ncbi:MAG TPA: hypothetical protein VII34_08260 [Pyrinomonadaceae bacterium]
MKFPLMLFLIVYLSASAEALGQSTGATASPTAAAVQATAIPDDVQYLKGQLNEIHSLHDSLISTAHWALGVALALTALLVGYNWFSTNRSLERDKQALRQELIGLLKADAADLHEKINVAIKAATDSNAKALREEVSSNLQNLVGQVQDLAENAEERHAQQLCTLTIHEALLWQLRGVPSNEFTQYIDLLDFAIPRDFDSEIHTALRQMLRLLGVHLTYSSSEVTRLTELLDKLPLQYASQVEVLKEALRKKLVSDPPL